MSIEHVNNLEFSVKIVKTVFLALGVRVVRVKNGSKFGILLHAVLKIVLKKPNSKGIWRSFISLPF